MAPQGKRKRPDSRASDMHEGRPSPHRPQTTNLGQHDRGSQDMRDQTRRSSRGGPGGGGGGGAGGGRGGRRNEARDNQNNSNKLSLPSSSRATPTPGPMSPPAPKSSSAAADPTQLATPAADIPSPTAQLPKQDLLPYDYAFLTEPRMSAWQNGGRQEVIALGIQARQDEDTMDLASVLQELTRAALDEKLDPMDAGTCVKEILGPDHSATDALFDAHTFFVDTTSVLIEAEAYPAGSVPQALRSFALATGVSFDLMRQTLEHQILQDLGLTRPTFSRLRVRATTNILYRQANYNLLREETEGYSKLITELFTSCEGGPPTSDAVEEAFERVKGLIGTFNLDVGRVLDVTLDVFAALLVKHVRFFIKLLRVSSWWPRYEVTHSAAVLHIPNLPNWALPTSHSYSATEEDQRLCKERRAVRDTEFWARAREVGLQAYYELGGRHIVDEAAKQRILNGDVKDFDADRQWMEITGTIPPSGNQVAAQLLGFKLRFYASPARDKDDVLPPNLIYLTALLIKVGFISLRDIYAHLWPVDEDMPAVKVAKEKEAIEKERLNRPDSAANALTMASVLPDDAPPLIGARSRETAASKSDPAALAAGDVQEQDRLDEPTDQKILLLVNLLTIGAIPESLFMLGRFPWLPAAHPDIIPLINRLLHRTINDLFDETRPISTQDTSCPPKQVTELDQKNVPKDQVRLTQLPTRKLLRWPHAEKYDTNLNQSYRFYWDEWADNVPVCQSLDDFFTLCDTLLNVIGVSIGTDSALLSKIARIGIKSLAEDGSSDNKTRWQDLLKRILVPAISLAKANTSVANEVYTMLRFFPTSVRYSIYAEWFDGRVAKQPELVIAFKRASVETKATMKRVSKTNIIPMAKRLAKTAYWAPGIVFREALSQIESYNNLAAIVVECAKYFTDLGYDVLVWSLLTSLGNPNRNRNKAENRLLPNEWLLALASFTGKVYRRYSIVDLSPMLQYINYELSRDNSVDLIILKELIVQMAGIVQATDFTDGQINAMAGGPELRKQTLKDLQDKRHESGKTAMRLMSALKSTNLSGELLVSLAQFRQSAIYRIPDDDAQVKLIATTIDNTQTILDQYLDLLRSNMSAEEFDQHVPGIPALLTDFGLEPALAFMIGRHSIAHCRASNNSILRSTLVHSPNIKTTKSPAIEVDGDIGLEVATAAQTNGNKRTPPPGTSIVKSIAEDTEMVDISHEVSSEPAATTEVSSPVTSQLQSVLEPIVAAVKGNAELALNFMSAEFYTLFWTCSLGDLVIPKAYNNELDRLMKLQRNLMNDRSDMTRTGVAQRDAAKKEAAAAHALILAEYTQLTKTFKQSRDLLLESKSSWFEGKSDDISDAFLEKCLIPRLLLSPADADYCFHMVKFLHDNGVPSFRTLSLYSRLFRSNRLRTLIFACTVREAENLGRFLRLILTELARWHGNSKAYEREAVGKNMIGFAKVLHDDGKPKSFLGHDTSPGFKSILYHWHKALNLALKDCFMGEEWMHIRNAITVLKAVVEVFPAVDFMGIQFVKQLDALTKRENDLKRYTDLSLAGTAVNTALKLQTKKWVMVQAFNNNLDPSQTNGTSKSGTPGSTLKPNAPEFKPVSQAGSASASTPKPTNEVEDGEVDDVKAAARFAAASIKASSPPTAAVATLESKRSEILDRREQIKRENAAKAAAATAQSHPGIPSRPSSVLSRGSPNLPSRPDAPIPSTRDLLDRHPPRHGDRAPRDPRSSDPRSLDRPGDRPGDRHGDRSRDFAGMDRRGMDPNMREFARVSDRLPGDRSRPEPPPRWTADSRPANGVRNADNGRLSREMPPPRSSGASVDRTATETSERILHVNPERQEIINPERAALISSDKAPSRSSSPRRGREDRDRVTSRPQSPRRPAEKDSSVSSDSRRDDRSSRNGYQDSYGTPRSHVDDQPPPVGPRSDRAGLRDRGNDRTAIQTPQSVPRSNDVDHGRLNPGPRQQQQQEPSFGRLTAPTPDIPSGPRDRSSRVPPMINGPQRRDGRADQSRPPTPEKQPPTGPSSGRHHKRSASGHFDVNFTTSGPSPTTPVAPSPASGVHPDRMKHLGGPLVPQHQHGHPLPPPPQYPQQAQNQSTNQPVTPGIHPDRLRAFGNDSPSQPATHMNNNRARPYVPPVSTGGPPLGPKGSQSSPIGQVPNGITAPTGPASAHERAARGGRRQLTSINTMLQQAGQQNTPDRMHRSSRGRMGSAIGGPETPVSGPPTPSMPLPPPPPFGPPRADPAMDLINPARADLITGTAPPSDDREKGRSDRRGHGSGRHSRRNSRSPGRERDSKHASQEDDRSSRSDYRERSDRRESGRDTERERHRVLPTGEDLMAEREAMGPRGGGDRERRDRQSSRRESGRERDGERTQHDATQWPSERGGERTSDRGGIERVVERGSGGRSRDVREPRSEETRELRENRQSRGGEDGGSGRKRRDPEGGTDSRSHGHDQKRPRRG